MGATRARDPRCPRRGGNIAVAALASARPDGYTVGQVPGQTIFVMPYLEKQQVNPARDLTFIAQFAEANFAIAELNHPQAVTNTRRSAGIPVSGMLAPCATMTTLPACAVSRMT